MSEEKIILPRYNEIPDVGLYLDQVSKYINSCTEMITGQAMTNSMISNYVKHDLIPNPIKKLYYRDQIAKLIFIAVTKSVLSLNDAGFIFQLQEEKLSVKEAYMLFVDKVDICFSGSAIMNEENDAYTGIINQTVRTVFDKYILEQQIRRFRGEEPEKENRKKK